MGNQLDKKIHLKEQLSSGYSYMNRQSFAAAIENFQKALKLADELEDKANETEACIGLGYSYIQINQIQTAIEYYEKALEIARAREDSAKKIKALLVLANSHIQINQIQTAIEYYEKALEVAREREDKSKETNICLGLGHSYEKKNQIQTAIEYYEKALEIAREREYTARETYACMGLGDSYRKKNQIQTAIEYYEEALEIARARKSTAKEINACLALGDSYIQVNQTQKAIEYYEKALKIARKREDKANETDASLGLGHSYIQINQTQTAIEYYEKALEIAREREDKANETDACLGLGHSYIQINQTQTAIEYYEKSLKIAGEQEDKANETDACLGLGHSYRKKNQIQTAIEYYEKALKIARERDDKEKDAKAYIELGDLYIEINQKQTAIKYYEKALEIAKEREDKANETEGCLGLGQSYRKKEEKEEAEVYLKLGDIFYELTQYEKAIESYQHTLSLGRKLEDEEMKWVVIQKSGKLCLTLASSYSKDCDYDKAIEWYKKALEITETGSSHHVLYVKALTGLGVAMFYIGHTESAIESIRKAQSFSDKEVETDLENVVHQSTHEHKNSTDQTPPPINAPPVEWLNEVVVEGCDVSKAKSLADEDLVQLENSIKTFSAKYVYTHPTSSKDLLTEKVRQTMTTNVKSSAYKNLLGRNQGKLRTNNGTTVDDDEQIVTFARNDISKNVSTKVPALLLQHIYLCLKSIGQISCGRQFGTCWLVKDTLVITNHHVYMMFNTERNNHPGVSLPITVSFDFFDLENRENVQTVEVDEQKDPQIEGPHLDYKFLRLKECEALTNRARLGTIVRSRRLQDGRVIIVGHPAEKQMFQETCVVVMTHSWRQIFEGRRARFQQLGEEHRRRIGGQRRHEDDTDLQQSAGLHMANEDFLQSRERDESFLPYDTSLFSGTSGSPVFDLNGKIVAMHTQRYTLGVDGGKQYSLMDFGVQFSAICEDLKRRNLLEELFPNCRFRKHGNNLVEENR